MEKFRDSNLYKDNLWQVIKKDDGTYMLKCDGEIAPKIKHKHQFHIPPQPFQGNPDAAIWVLLANPGYSKENNKNYYCDDTAYVKDCDINGQQESRLNSCLAQLSFKKAGKYHNYVLNEEFRGEFTFYGTKWFLDRFVGNNKLLGCEKDINLFSEEDWHTIDDRFFLLQVHGYASKEFDSSCYFKHMDHNIELLKWGIKAGKVIVIARRHEYWHEKIEEEIHDDSKIFVMLNNRNASFTENNLVSYEDWKRSQEIIKNAKENAKEILTEAKSKVKEKMSQALNGN